MKFYKVDMIFALKEILTSNSMVVLFKQGLPHILCAPPKMPPPKTIVEIYFATKITFAQ